MAIAKVRAAADQLGVQRLAVHLGASKSKARRLLRGSSEFTVTEAAAVAAAHGLPLSTLLGSETPLRALNELDRIDT